MNMDNNTAYALHIAIAVVLGLNSIGVFALLFRVGKYIGTTDTRLATLESLASQSNREYMEVSAALVKHGETLIKLETQMESLITEVKLVRQRQHDLANHINALGVSVQLRPAIIASESNEEKEGR